MKRVLLSFFILQSVFAFAQSPQGPSIWMKAGYEEGGSVLSYLDLDDDYELSVAWERKDDKWRSHVKYQLIYKSKLVFGAEVIAHYDPDNNLTLISGKYPRTVDLKDGGNAGEIILSAQLVPELDQDELVLINYNLEKNSCDFVGNRGVPVLSVPLARTFQDTGLAITKYSGTQEIITTLADEGGYELSEVRNGVPIETYNAENLTVYALTDDFTQEPQYDSLSLFSDEDNFWDNFNEFQDELATDIHWGTETTLDYFQRVHNWLGLDGSGGAATSILHIGDDWDCAFYLPPPLNFMGYGDGGPIGANATLDVVAHEITHAVVHYSAGLVYLGEASVLDEGLADIFSAAVKFYVDLPELENPWLLAEQLGTYRNMADPKAKKQPDTYKGDFWYSGDVRTQFAHQNNGVLNYWFYLLTEGGLGQNDNGYTYFVKGIGIEKSSQIAFDAMTFYLTAFSDLFDFKKATIQVTKDTFGEGSSELSDLIESWAAVGVVETVTAVSDQKAIRTAIHRDFISIYFDTSISPEKIHLLDLNGRDLSAGFERTGPSEYVMRISEIPPGLYLLVINEGKSSSPQKILIRG